MSVPAADTDVGLLQRMPRTARREWIAGAAHAHFGRCESCGRWRDENDKPLFVCRQPRRRRFECFPCHLGEPVHQAPLPETPLP